MFTRILVKQYYQMNLPFFIIIGGIVGTSFGIATLDKQIMSFKRKTSPLEGFGMIIGGFSVGVLAGLCYPVTCTISGIYIINKSLKDDY